VYGHDELAPPRYDLALLAPHVIGLEAHEIMLTTVNQASRDASFITPWMFWVLLAVAVLLLLALVARLVAQT
jgi:hypothetical protein